MRTTTRRGFTLVELLVAIGIMLALVGLAVVVANSGIVNNQKLRGGSDRVAGWLMQARARAQREQAPRGVRFIPDPANPTLCREAQLIEVPDPFNLPAGNQLMLGQWVNGVGATERHIYIVGPNAASVQASVSVGDTLTISSLGSIHRVTGTPGVIVNIGGVNTPAVEITVFDMTKIPDLGAGAGANTTPPTPTYATTTFGFIRQARPVFGEPGLLVPEGIAIDVLNSDIPTGADGSLDVIFAPNGEVMYAGGIGRVVLWIRNPEAFSGNVRNPTGLAADQDVRANYEAAGEMSLVTVYSRTGGVAVHPVIIPPNAGSNPTHDPKSATKDGVASGL